MSSRETGNVFQSLKLNQTVSHICGNFSNMFVAELELLANVAILFDTVWNGCSFTSFFKEYGTEVVSSMLMSVDAQEEYCI